MWKHTDVEMVFKSTNTLQQFTQPKTANNTQE